MTTIDTKNLSPDISSKYSVVNNAFVLSEIKNAELDIYKNEPKDEINIVVGDDKQPDIFYPQVKLQRWTNEVNFSVRLTDADYTKATVSTFTNQIVWQKDNVKIEFFDVPATATDEGSYKMVWYLLNKPLTNTVSFSMQSKGLDFFYQPPMTQEKLEDGQTADETHIYDKGGNIVAERPENVVGSYAVYHSTKGGMNDADVKDYKTGKAFHIYRPHLFDVNGLEAWGNLNIDATAGTYTVTIPQDFLDKAVYPIKSNDTFGYITVGTTNGTAEGANIPSGYPFISGGTVGSATSMSFASYVLFGQSANLKGFITDSSGNIISNGITNSVNFSQNSPATTFNVNPSFSSSPTISASTNYILWFISDNNLQGVMYDTGDVSYVKDATNSFSSPTSPTDFTSVGHNYKFSIYATYTPSGLNVFDQTAITEALTPLLLNLFTIPNPDQTLVYDQVFITEVATATFSVSDSTTVTDNFSSLINENLSVSDSTAVSDLAPTTILVMYINTSNQIVVTDSATLQIQTVAGYTISVSDTATVTDSTSEVTSALLFSVIQQMQVADLFQFLVSTSPSVSNTITVTDNYAFTITSLPTLAIPSAFDSTAVTDNASVTNSTLSINASDTVTTVDTQNAGSSFYIINQSESITITDVYLEVEVLEIYNDLNIYANWVPGLKIIG